MEPRLRELEVERRGEGGKREARPHEEANVKGRDKQFKGFLRERGEMRCGALIYTRTGANSILFATVPFTLAE